MGELNLNDPEVAYIDGKISRTRMVYWLLGNQCVYKCSYCVPEFNSGSSPYHNTQVVQDTLKKLPPCDVLFGGGEPTYHPDIEQIILEKPNHISMSLLSNAARPIAFWERIAPALSSVYLSYHIEYANLERFMAVAELCYKVHKHTGHIALIMVPSRWDDCVAVYDAMVQKGLPIAAKEIVDSWSNLNIIDSSYTPDQLTWIAKSTYPNGRWMHVLNKHNEVIGLTDPAEIMSKRMNKFKGWTCYVPKFYTRISETGEVTGACCKQAVSSGNIFTGFTIPEDPMVCRLSNCVTYCDIAGIKSSPTFTGKIPGV